jgi:dTDP-4-amino-4,6-dideoxygalactose transaminase
VEDKITDRTRAIIPVHLYGNVCDMDAIMELAEKHDLMVLEDAAEAYGATYRGQKVGTIGHAGAVSFCQSKTFTTGGEGGMVLTDDEDVAWLCRSIRDHGYNVKERMRLLEMEAKLPYIHDRVGYNFRMTEMQSVIGLCELDRMDSYHLKRRRELGTYLTEKLQDIPEVLYLPPHDDGVVENGFWVYPVVLDIDSIGKGVRDVVDALDAEGIPCGPVFWPQSYKEKCFAEQNGFGRLNYPFGDPNADPESVNYDDVHCDNAAWLEERTLVLHCIHPTAEVRHMEMVVEAIEKVLDAWRK